MGTTVNWRETLKWWYDNTPRRFTSLDFKGLAGGRNAISRYMDKGLIRLASGKMYSYDCRRTYKIYEWIPSRVRKELGL